MSQTALGPVPHLTFTVVEPREGAHVSIRELLREVREQDALWRKTCKKARLPVFQFKAGGREDGVARDGRNVVTLATTRFCPKLARDSMDCYGKRRQAITHRYMSLDSSGTATAPSAVEVDIEVNGANYRFVPTERWSGTECAVPDASQHGPCGSDLPLGPVLLHELGHAFGLSHSCEGQVCIDNRIAAQSVMYPDTFSLGELRPRVPADSDCAELERLYGERPAPGWPYFLVVAGLVLLFGLWVKGWVKGRARER